MRESTERFDAFLPPSEIVTSVPGTEGAVAGVMVFVAPASSVLGMTGVIVAVRASGEFPALLDVKVAVFTSGMPSASPETLVGSDAE